jgi:hypothetical protein
MLLAMFRYDRLLPQTEIVPVQELVRFSFSLLEFAYAGQTDRSKHGANRLRLAMLIPDRLGYDLHEVFPQGVVTGAPDLIEQPG